MQHTETPAIPPRAPAPAATSPRALSAAERLHGAAPGGGPPQGLIHHTLIFRAFGLPGLGAGSFAAALAAFGYSSQPGRLKFPRERAAGVWFAPPPAAAGGGAALPRVLVFEVQVGAGRQQGPGCSRRLQQPAPARAV